MFSLDFLGGAVFLSLIGLMAFMIYALPGLIAFRRKHASAPAIMIFNIVFGWSFIGWIVALIWASSAAGRPQVIVIERS